MVLKNFKNRRCIILDCELIGKWSKLLDSNAPDKEILLFFGKIVDAEPDLKTMGQINILLLEKREQVHAELRKFINRYAAIEALRKKLNAHKKNVVYKN